MITTVVVQPPWRLDNEDRPSSSGGPMLSADGSVLNSRPSAGRAHTVVEMALNPSIAANMELQRRGKLHHIG